MIRTFVAGLALCGLLLVTGFALADELKGTVSGKADTDKMTFKVKGADDKEVVIKYNKDTKFAGGKGGTKDLDDKALKDGAKCTITFDKKGDDNIATKVLMGGKK